LFEKIFLERFYFALIKELIGEEIQNNSYGNGCAL